MPKPGWKLETVTGPTPRRTELYGSQLSEGVTEITWTGELPDAFYDEFVFRGSLAADLAPGSMLYFPVVQECASATEAGSRSRPPGRTARQLETPAPG